MAAIDCGACLAGADPRERRLLGDFGARIGLAFQAQDDLLDATGSSTTLGKDVGKDEGRPSLVSLLGRKGALEAGRRHFTNVMAALNAVPRQTDFLQRYVAHVFNAEI